MSAVWQPVLTTDGSWTLAHPLHGETCHSRAGAWEQARERYARPCRLAERARAPARPEVLRVLDVGTGLGLNIAAALEALSGSGTRLSVVTLERDPSVIRAGCALFERAEGPRGPWEPFHACVRAALGRALLEPAAEVALGEEGKLRLLLGDARETIASLAERAFDAVFLDPFSPAREPDLWEEDFLCALARRVASGGWLSTYSAATRVRSSLARAGLKVGRGPRVGQKNEGTLASPTEDPPPLAPRTARRIERRSARS